MDRSRPPLQTRVQLVQQSSVIVSGYPKGGTDEQKSGDARLDDPDRDRNRRSLPDQSDGSH